MNQVISLKQLESQNGQEVGVSDWIEISQDMIDEFAKVTQDLQFIHIDPERAAKTPFGGTIAHGFLTLSLTSKMANDILPVVENTLMLVNYGCEKLRFISPVPSGSRVRGRYKQLKIEHKPDNRFIIHYQLSVEIENNPKLALVTEWLTMIAIA